MDKISHSNALLIEDSLRTIICFNCNDDEAYLPFDYTADALERNPENAFKLMELKCVFHQSYDEASRWSRMADQCRVDFLKCEERDEDNFVKLLSDSLK